MKHTIASFLCACSTTPRYPEGLLLGDLDLQLSPCPFLLATGEAPQSESAQLLVHTKNHACHIIAPLTFLLAENE